MDSPPLLITEDLNPTRNYLQDVVKVLGSLQLAFLPVNEHDWHYGLQVTSRGISTQELTIGGLQIKASLDLFRSKVRIGDTNWLLEDYDAPEILNNIWAWLAAHDQNVELEAPKFSVETSSFDAKQATNYANALWWLEARFKTVKSSLATGLASPILLYPHHFDLSLSWFPRNDSQQFGLGFSTGDDTIKEPYLYLTLYPEAVNFTSSKLPPGAYWQTAGFSGAILPYRALQMAEDSEALFKRYAALMLPDRA